MRTLSRYRLNNRTEVKFLQAWLNQFAGEQLSVDGAFGFKTQEAVKRYQRKEGLAVDGWVGTNTQKSMGFRKTRNANIVVLEIPFAKISKANVLLKDGQAYSCKRFADEYKMDIVWNGAFFNTANRKIVQLLVLNGIVQAWGMGYEGIAYPRTFTKAYPTTAFDINGQPLDMQGSAPTLIDNYITDHASIANFPKSIMDAYTRRNCTAITDTSILLFFSLTNQTLWQMRDEGLNQKVKFMQGNDGGGSQSLYMGGAYVITTDGRAIPAAVGLEVK